MYGEKRPPRNDRNTRKPPRAAKPMMKMTDGTTSESVGMPPICVPTLNVALVVVLDMISC